MNALNVVLGSAAILVGILVFDWSSALRVGSMTASFDYRYWPPSTLRIGSVMLLTAGSIIGLFWPTAHSIGPLKWSDAFFFLTVAVWGFVLWLDFVRQKRAAMRDAEMTEAKLQNRWWIGAGAMVLLVIAAPLWNEFQVSGNRAWNTFLAILLMGLAIGAIVLQRYFWAHRSDIGEARFDTTKKAGEG